MSSGDPRCHVCAPCILEGIRLRNVGHLSLSLSGGEASSALGLRVGCSWPFLRCPADLEAVHLLDLAQRHLLHLAKDEVVGHALELLHVRGPVSSAPQRQPSFPITEVCAGHPVYLLREAQPHQPGAAVLELLHGSGTHPA
eukprot:scaffold614_cov367-Prasinococcus_capsulatus_cf.AAC.29